MDGIGRQRWWRICATLGLVTLATVGWYVARQVPDCGVPLAAPMLDFEMATSRAQLAIVLDCQPRLAELDHQNVVDLGLFMWAYASFLGAFAVAAGVRPWLAFTMTAGVLAADVVETTGLRAIAAAWPAFDEDALMPLMIASRLKFVLICAVMVAGAWRLAVSNHRLLAALIALGGFANLGILMSTGRAATMLTAAAWLTILGVAIVNALRPPPSAPASPGV